MLIAFAYYELLSGPQYFAVSSDMKIHLTLFCQNMMNYLGEVKLQSVLIVIVLLYVFLVILWHRLLRKSRRDHEFGESFLSEHEPKTPKIKLV